MSVDLDKTTVLTTVGLVGGCLFLCARWFSPTIDDAFISFRYAKHLAEHGTLTWNLGAEPVSGYTSPLWVWLNAVVIRAGGDPVLVSKVSSVACALSMSAFLVWWGRDAPWQIQLGFPAGFALSPCVAATATQGLETLLAALLLLGFAVAAVRVVDSGPERWATTFYALGFLVGLARPDLLVFAAGTAAAVAAILWGRSGDETRGFVVRALPFVALGAGYLGFRSWYFGDVLPTTAYVKAGAFGRGFVYTAESVAHLLFPYLAVGLLLRRSANREDVTEIAPIVAGTAAFLVYLTTVDPIQGEHWRYAVPVVAPVLFACVHLFRNVEFEFGGSRVVPAALLALLVAFPLHTFPLVESRIEHSKTRTTVGRALQGLDGKLFTSESGALAYYSEWKVVDWLGLNAEEIARGASRISVLREFEPDLVGMNVGRGKVDPANLQWQSFSGYLVDNDFVVVGWFADDTSGFVFLVDPRSPICEAIVDRLDGVPDEFSRRPTEVAPDDWGVSVLGRAPNETADDVCRTGGP